jgi:PPM family protein phosphatase
MSAAEFASLSDVGRRRRVNQDSFGEFPCARGGVLLVCCDGMGGHQGGEVASQLAVETIGREFDGEAPAQSLPRAILAAHARVKARASERPELHGMGTTAVALYWGGGERAWVAHVGDSRCYRIRGGRIETLTPDHSIVAELLRSGRITPEQAAARPHNELTRAIGASESLQADCSEHDARDGDLFLLCSDGLWNMVDDPSIAAAAQRELPKSAVRTLVELANAAGGTDNVTVQILGIGSRAPLAPDDDDTERGRSAPQRPPRRAAEPRVDETRAVPLADVDVEAIWRKAQDDARAQRDRRIRALFMGAAIAAVALLGALALMWAKGGA